MLLVTRIRKTLSEIQPQSREITSKIKNLEIASLWFKIRRKNGECTLAKPHTIIQSFILEILVNIFNPKLSRRFEDTLI